MLSIHKGTTRGSLARGVFFAPVTLAASSVLSTLLGIKTLTGLGSVLHMPDVIATRINPVRKMLGKMLKESLGLAHHRLPAEIRMGIRASPILGDILRIASTNYYFNAQRAISAIITTELQEKLRDEHDLAGLTAALIPTYEVRATPFLEENPSLQREITEKVLRDFLSNLKQTMGWDREDMTPSPAILREYLERTANVFGSYSVWRIGKRDVVRNTHMVTNGLDPEKLKRSIQEVMSGRSEQITSMVYDIASEVFGIDVHHLRIDGTTPTPTI